MDACHSSQRVLSRENNVFAHDCIRSEILRRIRMSEMGLWRPHSCQFGVIWGSWPSSHTLGCHGRAAGRGRAGGSRKLQPHSNPTPVPHTHTQDCYPALRGTSVNCAGGANRSANRPISPQRANRDLARGPGPNPGIGPKLGLGRFGAILARPKSSQSPGDPFAPVKP